jgi:hypothetical protein
LKTAEDLSALASSSSESQASIIWSMKKVLAEEGNETEILRGLLLFEKILEEGTVSLNSLCLLRKRLEHWKSSENKQISVKSAKILAILELLKCSKAA